MSPSGTPEDSEPRPGPRRPRAKARWGLVLVLMAITWAAMCYGIYAVVSAGKL